MNLQRLLNDLVPGQYLDLDDIDPNVRAQFLDEFEGMGFVLNSDQVVGEVEECPDCRGWGSSDETNQADCRRCDGMCLLVDYGRGREPFYG